MVWHRLHPEAIRLVSLVPGIGHRIRDRQQDSNRSGPIGGLVTGFGKLARQFDDLNLADRGGTLELRQDLESVIRIRIELPKYEALRLATVLVDSEEITDLNRQVTVTASSILAEHRPAWNQRLLFDPDNTATAVHTKKQHRPWLEIAFDGPVHVARIFLRNVEEVNSPDVRGIQISACRADRGWKTIYDGWRRERVFVRAVERRCARWTDRRQTVTGSTRTGGAEDGSAEGMNAAAGLSPGSAADLAKILTHIQLRDYSTVRGDLDRTVLNAEQTAQFKSLVNQRLARRELEWSSHGIKKTFRFWSAQEKQDYLGFTVDVVRCLRELNDNVCLGFGTVLGLVRDHDLIPHDDDADVIIGFEPTQAASLSEGRRLISECLQDHGYHVTKNRIAHHWVTPPGGGVKLDAFAGIFEQNSISWYPGKRGVLTRQMVFPPTYIERLGQSCPIPREPERYLEQIYGTDWRIPDPYFHHRYEDVRPGYEDLRTPEGLPTEAMI